MVHRVTVHIGRRMGHPLGRRQLIRGIGLEEQTITGNGPQDRRMGGLSQVEGMARDAETAAEANPFVHQFGRPAVAVQQETPRKVRSPPQAIQQGSPSLQAMQGDGRPRADAKSSCTSSTSNWISSGAGPCGPVPIARQRSRG